MFDLWDKKTPDADLSDYEIALRSFAIELNHLNQTLADRRVARGSIPAGHGNGPSTNDSVSAEATSSYQAWSSNSIIRGRAIFANDQAMQTNLTRVMGLVEAQASNAAGSAGESASHSRRDFEQDVQCVACGEMTRPFDILQAPCKHQYCRDCVTSYFQASLTDETYFPPRCCHIPLPFDTARDYISQEVANEFQLRRRELETSNRIYCSEPRCSTWIPPERISAGKQRARCPKCRQRTCTICKGPAHSAQCPKDTALQQLQELAEHEQWQRCRGCGRCIELESGCFHIT
jgi:hypothetical protein